MLLPMGLSVDGGGPVLTVKLIFKTVLLAFTAGGLVFILRRPDLFFSTDLFSEAFYKNVTGAFTILPAVISYFATKEFTKPSQGSSPTSDLWPEKNQIRWDIYFKFIMCVSIIIIVCVLLSMFSGTPQCDENGSCDDPIKISETEQMMNFIRLTMAALVGMTVAFAHRD
jgi:hypothetical protein